MTLGRMAKANKKNRITNYLIIIILMIINQKIHIDFDIAMFTLMKNFTTKSTNSLTTISSLKNFVPKRDMGALHVGILKIKPRHKPIKEIQ